MPYLVCLQWWGHLLPPVLSLPFSAQILHKLDFLLFIYSWEIYKLILAMSLGPLSNLLGDDNLIDE